MAFWSFSRSPGSRKNHVKIWISNLPTDLVPADSGNVKLGATNIVAIISDTILRLKMVKIHVLGKDLKYITIIRRGFWQW